jgi:hypothetical protein
VKKKKKKEEEEGGDEDDDEDDDEEREEEKEGRKEREKGRAKGPHTHKPHARAKKTWESAQFVGADELRQYLLPVEGKVHTGFPLLVVNLRPKCRLL